MNSDFYITEEQFNAIEAARDVSADNQAAMYDLIYEAVQGTSAVETPNLDAAGNVQAWFGAAAQANLGVGASSTLIRNYTQTQIEIRTGQALTDAEAQSMIQFASNAIANGVFDDIEARREIIDGVVYYGIPNGEEIGDIDVEEFIGSLDVDIGTWSGNPLFTGLGIEKYWLENVLEDTTNATLEV